MAVLNRQRRVLLLFAAVLLLLIACEAASTLSSTVMDRGGELPEQAPPTEVAPTATPQTDRYTNTSGNFMGSPSAPVILTEFGDFHCPYCREFYDEHFDDLVRD